MTEPTAERAVSADGRWAVRMVYPDPNDMSLVIWRISDGDTMDTAMVEVPDAPGLTAAQVLSRWEHEQQESEAMKHPLSCRCVYCEPDYA